MRPILSCAMLTFIFVFASSSAIAAPITFIFSATGTGWVRDTPTSTQIPFTDAPFTIVASADTSNVVPTSPGVLAVLNLAATIEVAGVGSGDFLIPTRVFVSSLNSGAMGFSKVDFPPSPAYGSDLIDFHDSSLQNYQLDSSFGPVVDPAPFTRFNQFRDIAVSFGLLSFNDNYTNGTFLAIVPEPRDMRAALLSCVGLLVAMRTRNRLKRP